jgi:hypothetical protein
MNYRLGFQRVYAVLALAWMAGVLLILPSERVTVWKKWDIFDYLVIHPCIPIDDSYPTRVKESKNGSLPEGYVLEHTNEWDEYIKRYPERAGEPICSDRPYEPGFAESRIGRSLWLVGLLLGLPAVGYLGLFAVLPWIYRGFKSTA